MLEKQRFEFALNKETVLNSRYVIQEVLGVGGFGITYKAYDMEYNKSCAIKELFISNSVRRHKDKRTVIPLEGCQKNFEHGKKRFIEEAEILHRINDTPYVVKIIDFFQENNTAYYVMQYIAGMTLNKLVQHYGDRIPFELATDIIFKVGIALSYIYKKYLIIHRDLSPENILIDSEGNPIIIDFGNAKTHIRNSDKKLSVVLKPGFAPPEQYTGKGQGPWTDVYSLAGVFYYIVSGKRVPPSTERVVGEQYVSLCEFIQECPKDISDCIDQGLDLNYKNRIQDTGLLVKYMGRKEDNKSKDESLINPMLIIKSGQYKDKKWKLPDDTFVIVGRDSQMSNIVVSHDSRISKQHMIVQYNYSKKCFVVMDVSTNGIFINGVKVEKHVSYEVASGTIINIANGACILELRI